MQQRTKTLVVTLVIIAVTALGIWLPPIGEETAEQMRKAATSYEGFAKIFKRAAKDIQFPDSDATVRNPIAKNLAPAETAKLRAVRKKSIKALLRQARAYDALAAELRQRSFKH